MTKDDPILLVWDIDGTLLSCMGSGMHAMNKAFHSLYGIENAFNDINMAGRVDRSILKEVFDKHIIDRFDVDSIYDLYGKKLGDVLEHNCGMVYDGVDKILDYTSRSNKYYNVIGTGNCEIGAWLKLKSTKLDQYFHTGGFGSYDFERVGVIDKAINKAREFYLKPFNNNAKIFIIGDTPADIECSKKLNVKSIAIATGGYSVDLLRSYNPDYLLNSLSDSSLFFEIFEML